MKYDNLIFDLFNLKTVKSKLFTLAFCSLLFVLLSVPFHQLFPIGSGTELRPAGALPPVFGLLFGPWGALAGAIGTLAEELPSGANLFSVIVGFFIQFLYGYIPYKLWYTFRVNNNNSNNNKKNNSNSNNSNDGNNSSNSNFLPRLNNVNNLIKYIVIIVISTTLMTGLLTSFLGYIYSTSFISLTTFIVQFNNFIFSLSLGVLLLILANYFNVPFYIPYKNNSYKSKCHVFKSFINRFSTNNSFINSSYKHLRVFDFFLILAFLLEILRMIHALLNDVNMHTHILSVLFYICVIIFVFKPIDKKFQDIEFEDKKSNVSLTEKLIIIFVIIGSIISLITGIISFFTNFDHYFNEVSFWISVMLNISIILSTFYLASVFFLHKLEEDFSFPLESLSKISKKYSESNNKIADASSIISEIHKFENKDNEIGMLSNSFKILIQNLKDYMINLEKFTAERERINTELNIAYNIQSALLRRDFPPYPERKEFDIYAVSFPAKEVGGDFYDFFLIDDDHLAIIIADISGKGVPAAIFMAITKTLIKTLIINNQKLSKVVNMVNNLLCEDNEECMFATALIGVLTISSGEFSFVNAGHNLPLVKNKNNQINEVKANANFVLGGMDDLNYSKDTISLNKGDKLFLYTDGVTEAINQKNEFFGMKRLKSLLNEDLNIKDSLINIKKNITKFEGENNQFDDITMLMLEYDK